MGITMHDYDTGPVTPAEDLRRHRAWYRFQAVIFMVLGVTAAFASAFTQVGLTMTVGLLLLAAAFIHLLSGFQYRAYRTTHAISGFAMGIAGAVALFWAVEPAIFVYTMATLLVIEGAVQIYMGYALDPYRRGSWLMASGLIAAVLGLFLYFMSIPTGLEMLAFFIGTAFVLYGIALMRAVYLRESDEDTGSTGAAS